MKVRLMNVCAGLLLLQTNVLEASSWTWAIPSNTSGAFSGSESNSGGSMSGTMVRLSNSFIKLITTSTSGSNFPGTSFTRYAIEAPGFSLFTQPILSTESQIIQNVSGSSCPIKTWNGTILFSLWNPGSTFDLTSDNQAAFGSFSYNPATNEASITNIYNINSYTSVSGFSSFSMTGSCSNGEINFAGPGDRGGTLYLSEKRGGVYVTNANKGMYIIPEQSIENVSRLSGDYAAWNYDAASSQEITPARYTITTSGAVSGTTLTSIDPETLGTEGWSLSGVTINTPSAGMFTGNLSRDGGSSRKTLCTSYFHTKTVIFCVGQAPGNAIDPFNLIMVSDNAAFTNGEVDPYFGTNGEAKVKFGTSWDLPHETKIYGDGRILQVGYSYDGSDDNFAMARLHEDGSLDTSFGTNGLVTTAVSTDSDRIYDAVILPSEKIIVFGDGKPSSSFDWVIQQYNSNGSLDTSFGSSGTRLVTFGFGSDYANRMVVQDDGKLVFAGQAQGSSTVEYGIAVLTSDGNFYTGFDSDGKATYNIDGDDYPESLMLQTDGKYVAFGYSHQGQNRSWTAIRVNTDGTLDTSFGGGDGMVLVDPFGYNHEYVIGAALQTDGKFVVGGYTSSNNNLNNRDFAWGRFNSDGSPDTTFGGGDGYNSQSIGAQDKGYSVTLMTDGRFLLNGWGYISGTSKNATIRVNTDGNLDTSFGTSGIFTYGVGTSHTFGLNAYTQEDGKILLSGSYREGSSDEDFYMIRVWP